MTIRARHPRDGRARWLHSRPTADSSVDNGSGAHLSTTEQGEVKCLQAKWMLGKVCARFMCSPGLGLLFVALAVPVAECALRLATLEAKVRELQTRLALPDADSGLESGAETERTDRRMTSLIRGRLLR